MSYWPPFPWSLPPFCVDWRLLRMFYMYTGVQELAWTFASRVGYKDHAVKARFIKNSCIPFRLNEVWQTLHRTSSSILGFARTHVGAENRWHIAFVWLDLHQAFHLHSTNYASPSPFFQQEQSVSNVWPRRQTRRCSAAIMPSKYAPIRFIEINCAQRYDRKHRFRPFALTVSKYLQEEYSGRASHARMIREDEWPFVYVAP